MLCGLRSLWITPRPWMSATAVATRAASRRKRRWASGSPASVSSELAVKVLQLEGGQALEARRTPAARRPPGPRASGPARTRSATGPRPADAVCFGSSTLRTTALSVGHPHRSVDGGSVALLQPLRQRVRLRRCASPLPGGWASPCPFSIVDLGLADTRNQTNRPAAVLASARPDRVLREALSVGVPGFGPTMVGPEPQWGSPSPHSAPRCWRPHSHSRRKRTKRRSRRSRCPKTPPTVARASPPSS